MFSNLTSVLLCDRYAGLETYGSMRQGKNFPPTIRAVA